MDDIGKMYQLQLSAAKGVAPVTAVTQAATCALEVPAQATNFDVSHLDALMQGKQWGTPGAGIAAPGAGIAFGAQAPIKQSGAGEWEPFDSSFGGPSHNRGRSASESELKIATAMSEAKPSAPAPSAAAGRASASRPPVHVGTSISNVNKPGGSLPTGSNAGSRSNSVSKVLAGRNATNAPQPNRDSSRDSRDSTSWEASNPARGRDSRDSTSSSVASFPSVASSFTSGDEPVPEILEGTVFIRNVSLMIFRSWKASWAQLHVAKGVVKVWTDKAAKLRGELCIEEVDLTPGMVLSSMKVAAGLSNPLPPRIFYRHMADIGTGDGAADAASARMASAAVESGSTRRVWKFGLESQSLFSTWSRALRASIDALAADVKAQAARAAVMDSAMSANDFLRSAILSPPGAAKQGAAKGTSFFGRNEDVNNEDHEGGIRGKARKSRGSSRTDMPVGPFSITVHCLDGSEVVLSPESLRPAGLRASDEASFEPSVALVCIAMKKALGVVNDAEMSLFLASVPGDSSDGAGCTSSSSGTCAMGSWGGWGGHSFTCLPDLMSAREASSLVEGGGGKGGAAGRGGAGSAPGLGSSVSMSPPLLGGHPLPAVCLVYRRRAYLPMQPIPPNTMPTLETFYGYEHEGASGSGPAQKGGQSVGQGTAEADLLGLGQGHGDGDPVGHTPFDSTSPTGTGMAHKSIPFPALPPFDPADMSPFDSDALDDWDPVASGDSDPGLGMRSLRIAFIEAAYAFITGYMLIPLLEEALAMAGLHILAVKGAVTTPADCPPVDWYRRNIAGVLPATTVWQHKATTGEGAEGLATRLQEQHRALSAASMSPGAARRLYVRRAVACPEYGALFFVGDLSRFAEPGVAGSKTTGEQPAWLKAITADGPRKDKISENGSSNARGRKDDVPAPLPVLIGMCHLGIMVRPLPPRHPAASSYAYTPCSLSEGSATLTLSPASQLSPAERLATQPGITPGWFLNPITHIEVWGTKKSRPVFTYRSRERGGGVTIELAGPHFREAASSLHAIVFMLLAQKEGRARAGPRASGTPGAAGANAAGQDSAAMAAAVKAATRRAKAEAMGGEDLPTGWTEIVDPGTGATAYWNVDTKRTVFSRPARA